MADTYGSKDDVFGHPRGLTVLATTEMWERFSFYGLRALLVLFMTAAITRGGFGFDRTNASAILGIYAAPTAGLDRAQLARLWRAITARFTVLPDAEVSAEVNPEVTSLNQLTLLMAKSHGPVRFNAVAPGLVATPWTKDWDAQHAAIAKAAPLKRSATPDDCAEAVLACLRNTYMTGEILVIDGGITQVM